MIIHIHFHLRATGVTRSIENIFPVLIRYSEAMVFGYGIDAPKISFVSLLREVYSNNKTTIHTHRNNEIIFALILRLLRGKFNLVFTRHAESKPSGFTCFLMKKADHLVSLSSSMAKKLPFENTMIRHGVNTEIFKIRDKIKIDNIPQKNLITAIGRLRPAKGQLVVLEALLSTLKNNPNWGLMLIGKTDDKEYADKISSLALKNGIARQVHLVPETSQIADYYGASTIVVIASVSEGFSLVCLEAMSCGLTTIATESVGIHSEVIKHGENGFLFPVNDHESLSRIISDIISGKIVLDPVKIRQTILENWSVEKNVRELLKLYDNIPHPPTPSPRREGELNIGN
jgi:mannosyltransferase